MRIHSSLLLLLALPCTAWASDVHVVDPTGGGGFTTIADAYATAAAGDVLLVKSGSYPGMVIDRGVSITADTGHQVRWMGAVEVRNIPLAESVVLSGMLFPQGITMWDSAGAIRLQSSHVYGGDLEYPYRAIDVRSCTSVEITASVLRGGDGGADYWGEGELGGAGIRITNSSQVGLFGVDAFGGDGGDGEGGGIFVTAQGGPAGHGASVYTGSELFALGCRFDGGDGGDGLLGGDGGEGGDGLHVDGGIARVTDVSFDFGVGGAGEYSPAADGVPWTGQVTDFGFPGRELLAPTVVRESETVTWTLIGRPGDHVFLPASLLPKYRFLMTALGVQSFDFPLFHGLVPVGVIGPGSQMQIQVSPDPLPPGEEARILFHQIFVLDAGGQRILGTPHAEIVVADGL